MGENWPSLLFVPSETLVLLRNQDDEEQKSGSSIMAEGLLSLNTDQHLRDAAEFSFLTALCSLRLSANEYK